MRNLALAIGGLLILGGCETATKEVDLEAEFAAHCAERGYKNGTPEFDACVEDERRYRLIRRSGGTVY